MKLSRQDYIDILNWYDVKFSKDLPIKLLRKMTEKIVAEKLCRCIKKVPNEGNPESRAIGICNWSVLQKKKLAIYKFSCKKKPELKLKKGSNKNDDKLYKTSKVKLSVKKTRKNRKN
tara:strand:- start:3149 stop:3499 length:351 start_codon:yes stop_codon:yes gene_type:complete